MNDMPCECTHRDWVWYFVTRHPTQSPHFHSRGFWFIFELTLCSASSPDKKVWASCYGAIDSKMHEARRQHTSSWATFASVLSYVFDHSFWKFAEAAKSWVSRAVVLWPPSFRVATKLVIANLILSMVYIVSIFNVFGLCLLHGRIFPCSKKQCP